MKNLVIIDTETTGVERTSKIVELAVLVVDVDTLEILSEESSLVNPEVPIPAQASAIHHIYDKDVYDQPTLFNTESYRLLMKYNTYENVVVAHNAAFDLCILYHHGVHMKTRVMDTLTCSRHVFKVQSYKLKDLVTAVDQNHRALDDCKMVHTLVKDLLKHATMPTLIQHTQNPIIGFGKHKGTAFKDLQHSYLDWIIRNCGKLDHSTSLLIKYIVYNEMITHENTTFLRCIGYLPQIE